MNEDQLIEQEAELLSLEEVSALLRLKVSTLRAWRLKQCHLPFVKMGRLVRVRRADVLALIARSIVPPKEAK
jgi:excisionase family DNA binding protein